MANPLEFIIKAKDEASEIFEKVVKSTEKANGRFTALKVTAGVLGTAAAAGLVAFGKASIDSAEEAEVKQELLTDAYRKFPQIASVNIEALRALNEELMRKTGFDENDLAAGQSTLAQYKLTGQQIEKLTPLVADYAAKTGVDLKTAFDDVGKSLLGQGRALKDVGINYKNTGSVAGNFSEVLNGLKQNVGGTAEAMGTTAAGQSKILGAEFDSLRVSVGTLLLPVIKAVTGGLIGMVRWIQDNLAAVKLWGGILGITAGLILGVVGAVKAWEIATKLWTVATKAWTAIQVIANAVMDANPIGLVILAIAALIAIIVLLVTHWKQVVAFIQTVWGAVVKWLIGVTNGFGQWWNAFWGGIGRFLANVWDNGIVAPIRAAIIWITNGVRAGLSVLGSIWSNVWNGLVGVVRGVMNGVIDAVSGGINGAINILNGMIGAFNSIAGLVHIHINAIPHVSLGHFAGGTNDAPGGFAVVGEKGPEIMNVPSHAQITANSKPATVELGPNSIREVGRMVYAMIQEGAYVTVRDALG